MDKPDTLPTKLLILISLIQGLCLLYLHQAIDLHFWPDQQPQWLFALYSLTIIWPTMLLLGLNSNNLKVFLVYSLPYALAASLLGFYIGYQAQPMEHIRYSSLLTGYIITMGIATFKALMYCQQWTSNEGISYSALFRWSWRNFLTLGLALLFAACFWLVLTLWGALFKAINIDFFKDLFEQEWFYYPALALANGFGVIIFRRLTGVIDTITRIQQALIKYLLVLLSLVSLLFLSALAFTGLEPLWDSGGSGLILWMQALILFSINTVYQDEPNKKHYNLWLHRFIYLSVAVLPVYSAISFYGLYLRVDQYGWSISRCWAYFIWFALSLFALSYCWGIIKRRDDWVQFLSRINIFIGLAVLALMLLVNTPLLDFRKIVVNSQMQRLAEGKTSPDKLDIFYFARHTARPGYVALQELKQRYKSSHPNLALKITNLYKEKNQKPATQAQFVAAIKMLNIDPPEALLNTLYKNETKNQWDLQSTQQYYLTSVDANLDGELEYIWVKRQEHWTQTNLYYLENNKWQFIRLQGYVEVKEFDPFFQSLIEGDIFIEPPKWQNIVIGETRFKVGS